MKNLVLILPYFGKFKNYFPLFLKSCATNKTITWLLYTDNEESYDYPSNVTVIKIPFVEWQKKTTSKFDFDVNISAPYKLCDYKPAYGYLLEDDIKEYDYWGYCDCDLMFGDLQGLLLPLLDKEYDKIFAAGHLTVYRNTYENNRRFMKPVNGREVYKDVFSVREIKAFDEDLGKENVHEIFLQDGASVFAEDYSVNPNVFRSHFQLMHYDPSQRAFVELPYRDSAYFWHQGHIIEVWAEESVLKKCEHLYMHLQMRNMTYKTAVDLADTIQVLPNVFKVSKLPETAGDFKKIKRKCMNRQQWDLLVVRIKRKLKMFH